MPLKRLSSSLNSIGGMSRQITLNAPGGRNAADGGPVPPSPAIVTWGNKRALRGQELDKAAQIAQEADSIIRIPYQIGVNEDMTVGFEGRIFQIHYIDDEDEQHWFLDLYCAEIGQNAGGDVALEEPTPETVDPYIGSATPTIAFSNAVDVALTVPYVSRAGNALLLFSGGAFGVAGAVISVIDSNGNPWTRAAFETATAFREECWYILDSAPIAFVTVVFAGGGNGGAAVGFIVGVSEYGGVAGIGASAMGGGVGTNPTITLETTVNMSTVVAGFFLRADGTFEAAGQGTLRYGQSSLQASLAAADAMGGAPGSQVTIALETSIGGGCDAIAVELIPA